MTLLPYPAIFELDDNGEATGIVYPFCSAACMESSTLEGAREPSGGEYCGPGDEEDDAAQCVACFKPLQPRHEERMTTTPEIHKAAAAAEFSEDAASVCIHCHRDIKRVPGGQGPTWVHTDSGAVVGSGAPREAAMAGELPAGYRISHPRPGSPHYGRVVLFEPGWPTPGAFSLHADEESARAWAVERESKARYRR